MRVTVHKMCIWVSLLHKNLDSAHTSTHYCGITAYVCAMSLSVRFRGSIDESIAFDRPAAVLSFTSINSQNLYVTVPFTI